MPKIADWEEIFGCLASYNLHRLSHSTCADPDFSSNSMLTVRNAICHVDLSRKSWVAEEGNQVLGFCCWDWLDQSKLKAKTVLIAVAQQARSHGGGALLQQRRLEQMHADGAKEVHTWSDDPKAIDWYQRRYGYKLLGYETTRHCLHRFHFNGANETWAIHRGLKEHDMLAHLLLRL